MKSKNAEILRKIGYIIVFILSSIPLFHDGIMERGDGMIWLRRIEEVTNTLGTPGVALFPSAELTVECAGQFSALNSNLWLFFPALLSGLGISLTAAYRIYMLVLNVLSTWTAYKLLGEWTENKWAVFMGVLLFMTCPYRFYVYYDKANLGMAVAWVFLPLALWGMCRIYKKSADRKSMVVTAVAIAAVGYSDGILFLAVVGISLLGVLWFRRWIGVVPVLAGSVLSLPGVMNWVRYLLTEEMAHWGFPIRFIAPEGYVTGQFLSSWVYRGSCPGLGLGLLFALAVWVWLLFTEKDIFAGRRYGFWVFVMLLTALLCMQRFPWDILQRVCIPFLKLISLIEAPGVFFGFTSLIASGLGALAVEGAGKQEKLFVRLGFPIIIAVAAVGICIYNGTFLA